MSEYLQNLSDALADTVANSGAGVVRVDGRRRLSATGIAWGDDLIVTASHVVRRDEGIRVGVPNGDTVVTVEATMVGRDQTTDVAVLRVPAELNPLPQAKSDNPLRVGNLVLAVGRPGDDLQTSLGVVSEIGKGRWEGAVLTDVVMYPGFSGGALVDASGNVRGMNTSVRRGDSLAISTGTINQIVIELVKHGHRKQGFLGVGALPVRLPEELAKEFGQETGLLIAAVETDSPASKGGMFIGDIIVNLDGNATRTLDELLSLLTGDRVDQEVPVTIVRAGELKSISVTIGEKSK
jgi:S1-C subfamily serine protease